MRDKPFRMRAVEDYWLLTQVSYPGKPRSKLKKYADRAITALEASQQRLYTASQGQGTLGDLTTFAEIEVLLCGQQDKIETLEKLLNAAYELYADDGYLVTKEEWLETLQIEIGESS